MQEAGIACKMSSRILELQHSMVALAVHVMIYVIHTCIHTILTYIAPGLLYVAHTRIHTHTIDASTFASTFDTQLCFHILYAVVSSTNSVSIATLLRKVFLASNWLQTDKKRLLSLS